MSWKRFALAFLAAVLAAPPLYAGTHDKTLEVYDFSKGVDTYHATATLPDGFVQNSLNILFDDKAPGTKRAGYTVAWSTKSYSFTGAWVYVDASNVSWQIVRSSDQLAASNLMGTNVLIATTAVNDLVAETNAFGNAYFVDQTQGVYFWNGTSTTYVASSPKGSIISQFHNRVWVSGAAIPNVNQLYGSKYYDGTTWTTGVNTTDPVQYSVGLNDNFDNITAEYVYLDTLYLSKHASIFSLYGFDQSNFQISQITQECGCIDPNTIQTYEGGMKFVSLRGVENFNGYTCTRISDSVKNKVDPEIASLSFNQANWSQSGQSDFNGGTNVNTSESVLPGSVALSTASFSDSFTGTLSSVTLSGSVLSLSGASSNVSNNSFENGSFTSWGITGSSNYSKKACTGFNAGTCTDLTGCDSSNVAYYSGDTSCIIYAEVVDQNGVILFRTSPLTATSGCAMQSASIFGGASLKNKRVKFQFETNCSNGSTYLTTGSSFLCWGNNSGTSDCGYTFLYLNHFTVGSDGWAVVDNVVGGQNTVTSGSYTSASYDTGFTTTQPYARINYTATANTFTPALYLQASPDASTWSTLGTATVTDYLAKRYVRYISSFTPSGTDDGMSTLTGPATLNVEASSGVYTSAVHNISTATSMGNFTVTQNLTTGGAIAFAVCTSSKSNMTPMSCSTATANSQINVSTNIYAEVIATFTVTNSTNVPSFSLFNVAWFTSQKRPPMASTVWDNRYWLSLTTNTADTANDAVLVLNSHGAWAPLDIHAGAFLQYKNNLYHADSLGSGNIYLDNQGWGDNGNAINAFLTTKDYSAGDIAADHFLEAVYPSIDNLGNCSMSLSYAVDKGTATFTLGSFNQGEFAVNAAIRNPVPTDAAHQAFGKTFNFTFSSNDSQCGLNLYGLKGVLRERQLY